MGKRFQTIYEQVLEEIKRIDYEYRVDAGGMLGVLSDDEAIRAYMRLNRELDNTPELTNQEREKAREKIEQKIAEIQEEQERIEKAFEDRRKQREEIQEEKKDAFEKAKKRYQEKSKFKQIISRIARKSPEHRDIEKMTVQQIDDLYR